MPSLPEYHSDSLSANDPEFDSNSRPRLSRRHRLIAAVAAATALGAGIATFHHSDNERPSPHPTASASRNTADLKVDAKAVALRFNADASAIKITGEHATSKGALTAVDISATLTTNPAALPALKRYAHDPALLWFPPNLGADLEQGDLSRYGAMARSSHPYSNVVKNKDGSETISNELLMPTDCPAGTVADIYVEQPVSFGLDMAHGVDGVKMIGTMILEHGKWQISDQPPAIPTHIRENN